ncbi:MAG: tetratricopeptide repeat protein [Candidatus Coatesbacteria bacterium]|nr:tetratricopeptide repeat protein [Candidatus Coatesbacteria bacterium]
MIPLDREFWGSLRKKLLEAQIQTQKGNFKEAISEYENLLKYIIIEYEKSVESEIEEIHKVKKSFFGTEQKKIEEKTEKASQPVEKQQIIVGYKKAQPIQAEKEQTPPQQKEQIVIKSKAQEISKPAELKSAETEPADVIELEQKPEDFSNIEKSKSQFAVTDKKTTLQSVIEKIESKAKQQKTVLIRPQTEEIQEEKPKEIKEEAKKDTPLFQILPVKEEDKTPVKESKAEEKQPLVKEPETKEEAIDDKTFILGKQETKTAVPEKKEEDKPEKQPESMIESPDKGVFKFRTDEEKTLEEKEKIPEEKKETLKPPESDKTEDKKEEKKEEPIEEKKEPPQPQTPFKIDAKKTEIKEKDIEEKISEEGPFKFREPEKAVSEQKKSEEKRDIIEKVEMKEEKPKIEAPVSILHKLQIQVIENPSSKNYMEREDRFIKEVGLPPAVQDWRKIAQEFAEKNDLYSMALAYEQVTRIDAKDNNAWLGEAIGFISAGDLQKAINALEQLSFAEASECGSAEQIKAFAEFSYINSYFSLGIKFYYKLPETAEQQLSIGQGHFYNHHWPEAINLFSHSLKLNENNPEAWLWLGSSYENWDTPDKAEEAYNKAIEIDEKYWDAYMRLGMLLLHRGIFGSETMRQENDRIKLAKDLFMKVLGKEPNHVDALTQMAYLNITQKAYKDGLEFANKGLEIDQENGILYYYKGIAEYRLNKIEESITTFVTSLDYSPDSFPTYYYLGILYRMYAIKSGDLTYLDHSAQSFETALSFNHDFPEAQLGLAETLIEKNDKEKAMEALENAKILQPSYLRVLDQLEQLLRKKGNIARAEELSQEISDLNKSGKFYKSPFDF